MWKINTEGAGPESYWLPQVSNTSVIWYLTSLHSFLPDGFISSSNTKYDFYYPSSHQTSDLSITICWKTKGDRKTFCLLCLFIFTYVYLWGLSRSLYPYVSIYLGERLFPCLWVFALTAEDPESWGNKGGVCWAVWWMMVRGFSRPPPSSPKTH